MNSAQGELGIINLICFMVVSARELVNEPKIYGPMRLVEATQRLIHLAECQGIQHELLTEVINRIREYPLNTLPEGEERFIKFMDDLVAFLASWVEQFYPASEGDAEKV